MFVPIKVLLTISLNLREVLGSIYNTFTITGDIKLIPYKTSSTCISAYPSFNEYHQFTQIMIHLCFLYLN